MRFRLEEHLWVLSLNNLADLIPPRLYSQLTTTSGTVGSHEMVCLTRKGDLFQFIGWKCARAVGPDAFIPMHGELIAGVDALGGDAWIAKLKGKRFLP